MSGYLIKDTTVEERINLIKSWQEPEDCVGGSGIDLFDMYDEYIKGKKEISEINQEFHANYIKGDADREEEEAPSPTEPNSSVADEISKLKTMLDQGILTDEEFSAAKKKVLGLQEKNDVLYPENKEKQGTARYFFFYRPWIQLKCRWNAVRLYWKTSEQPNNKQKNHKNANVNEKPSDK